MSQGKMNDGMQQFLKGLRVELRTLKGRIDRVEGDMLEFKRRYPRNDNAACASCGLPYQDFPCDMIVPDEQWKMISPTGDGGGLLCPNCICRMLVENGATCIKAVGEDVQTIPKEPTP